MTNPSWIGPDAYRALWSSSPDALVLTDANAMVLAANPAYCTLHKRSPDQLIGHSLSVIFPEAARPAAMTHYGAVFESRNRTGLYPTVVQLRDASQRLVESRIDFLTQEDGQSAMLSSVRAVPEPTTSDHGASPVFGEPPTFTFPGDTPGAPSRPFDGSPQTTTEILVDAIRQWGIKFVLGLSGTEGSDLP